MKDNSTIHLFEFPIFRFASLLYSVPMVGFLIWFFVKILNKSEPLLSVCETWVQYLIFTVYLVGYVAMIIKLFFFINTRVVTVCVDIGGFKFNIPGSRMIRWNEIKSCAFSRDKFELRSNSPASTIILGFGFMKIKVINCSTWTIFSRVKRKEYQRDFELFKQALKGNVSCKITS